MKIRDLKTVLETMCDQKDQGLAHSSLTGVLKMESPDGELAIWTLGENDLEIAHMDSDDGSEVNGAEGTD